MSQSIEEEEQTPKEWSKGGSEGRRLRSGTRRRKEDIVKTMSWNVELTKTLILTRSSRAHDRRGDLRRPAPRLHDGFRSLSIRTAGRPGAPSPKQILPGRVGCSTLVPHNTVSPSLSPEACTRLRWHGTVSVQGGVQV